MHIIFKIASFLDFESLKVRVRNDLLGRNDLSSSQRNHLTFIIYERYD